MESEEIKRIINLKREGPFWDFKRKPHSNNADLLHDIICMANSISEHNKYIIIGVTDPSEGCDIVGLDTETLNRKNQQQYIDFLRSKKFAGEIRPEINLVTINIDGSEIDILEIIEKKNKPYYLIEDYQGVKANYIYTRIGDTNTPKNRSADLYIIEQMWRQRFGIDLTPVERIKLLLEKKEEWIIDPGNKNYGYNKCFPEYQIAFTKCIKGRETYSYYYPNTDTYFGDIYLKYYNIRLREISFCWVDGYRYPMILPEIATIEYNSEYLGFYYYVLNSVEWKLNKILGLTAFNIFTEDNMPYIFFKNHAEKESFMEHLNIEINKVIEYEPSISYKGVEKRKKRDGFPGGISAEFIGKIVREYSLWSRKISDE